MSFILNALRKSEQERQSLHAETVTERILIKQPEQDKNKTIKFYAIIIMVNVLLIVGIVWFVRYSSLPYASPVLAPVATPRSVSEVTDKPKPVVKVIQQEKTTQVTDLKAGSIEQWVDAQKPKVTQEAKKPVITKETSEHVTEVNQAESVGVMSSKIKETNRVEALYPEPIAVKNDIPFLSDLPFDVKLDIPKLTINVFVYSEHVEESFVMIDMVKYKAGQKLSNGMTLKVIRPDSLVFDYQNHVFQIERP